MYTKFMNTMYLNHIILSLLVFIHKQVFMNLSMFLLTYKPIFRETGTLFCLVCLGTLRKNIIVNILKLIKIKS